MILPRFFVTLTFSMVVLFLLSFMLLAPTEGRDLHRREHTTLNTADLKSLNSREIAQLKQLTGQLAGLAAKRNSRDLQLESDSKYVRNLNDLENALNFVGPKSKYGRDLKQVLLSATHKQGEQLDNIVKKFADVSKVTERDLKEGLLLKADPNLKQIGHSLGNLASLNARDLKQGLFTRSSEDLQQAQKLTADMSVSMRDLKHRLTSNLKRNVPQKDHKQEKLASLSSVDAWRWIPSKQGTERDVKLSDQTDLGNLSPGNVLGFDWFPWKRITERDVKQSDQTEEIGNLSPSNDLGFDWFPWKRDTKSDVKQSDQTDVNERDQMPWKFRSLSSADARLLFPLKQGSEKNIQQRDKTQGDFGNLFSTNLFRIDWFPWKQEKARGMKRENNIKGKKELSVEKVGDCYYVCDDICDPICMPSCEIIC